MRGSRRLVGPTRMFWARPRLPVGGDRRFRPLQTFRHRGLLCDIFSCRRRTPGPLERLSGRTLPRATLEQEPRTSAPVFALGAMQRNPRYAEYRALSIRLRSFSPGPGGRAGAFNPGRRLRTSSRLVSPCGPTCGRPDAGGAVAGDSSVADLGGLQLPRGPSAPATPRATRSRSERPEAGAGRSP